MRMIAPLAKYWDYCETIGEPDECLLSIVVIMSGQPPQFHSLVSAASGNPLDACRNARGHELLATLQVGRASGSPNRLTANFPSASSDGSTCVENQRATSGAFRSMEPPWLCPAILLVLPC